MTEKYCKEKSVETGLFLYGSSYFSLNNLVQVAVTPRDSPAS